ncbi:MAG: hypothetical protein M9958_03140 [Chitinophagales bacterium]|nr:hypothetical protein [Chitinophagales bacterium]
MPHIGQKLKYAVDTNIPAIMARNIPIDFGTNSRKYNAINTIAINSLIIL